MNKKLIFWLICIVLAGLNIQNVDSLEVGLDRSDVGVVLEIPEAPLNYSVINTNSSDFWDNFDNFDDEFDRKINENFTGGGVEFKVTSIINGTLYIDGDLMIPYGVRYIRFISAGGSTGHFTLSTNGAIRVANSHLSLGFTGGSSYDLFLSEHMKIDRGVDGILMSTIGIPLGSTTRLPTHFFNVDASNRDVAVNLSGSGFVEGNWNITINSTVEKDLIVGGIIYNDGVFSSQSIFPHTNKTQVLLGSSVWTNVTFDQEETEIKRGITHVYNDNTNHTFTINADGIYDLDYDFDVIDTSGSSTDIDVAGRVVYINGTEIEGSVFETDITKKRYRS